MESLSGQHSGGLGLQLQMGDDVADKADNSADDFNLSKGIVMTMTNLWILLWTKLLVYVIALKVMGIAFLELWLKK